jgi:hypothetical protein
LTDDVPSDGFSSLLQSNLSTLGALLLEESMFFLLPNRMTILRLSIDNDPKATDKINSVLRKNGIKYTHHNDKVLVETPAERARTKQAVQVHNLRIAYLTSWSHLICRRGKRCPKSPQSQAQPRRLRNGHLDENITK